jgi:hypothetical protein
MKIALITGISEQDGLVGRIVRAEELGESFAFLGRFRLAG